MRREKLQYIITVDKINVQNIQRKAAMKDNLRLLYNSKNRFQYMGLKNCLQILTVPL